MSEAWKPVVGFEGLYEVAACGAIRNARTLRWLSPSAKDDGYTSLTLYKDGRPYTKAVHRIVAEAHLPNPECKPQVNHKDLNKKNNDVSNLEWVTQGENLGHAIRNGTNKTRISKLKMNEKYHEDYVRDDSSCEHGEFPEDYSEPQTNYDRITASTESLAQFISSIADCYECENMHGYRMCDAAPEKACEDCWLDWLRQEAGA